MRKKLKLLFLYTCPLFLGGCVTWQDVVDTVNNSWATIVCWLQQSLAVIIQALIDFAVVIINSFSLTLPVVSLPVIAWDNSTMSAIAYFVPVSETAIVFLAITGAYISYYAVLVILRWLKIIRG